MKQNYKNKIIDEIEELRLNFTDDMYNKTLKKVLNSNDAELIYIFKSKIESAPTEFLATEIMKYDEDILNDIKKNTWRIKFAKEFGNINMIHLWRQLYYMYKNRKLYAELGAFDIEEFNNNLLLFSTIEGAPTNDIYDFIKENYGLYSELMKQFFNSKINLNLKTIINQFESLDIYNGENPKDIYQFVLNYQENINKEQMDEIISIFLKKLQDYHNSINLRNYHYEAIDTLILFLTNIKTLNIVQQRELLKNSLKRIKIDPNSIITTLEHLNYIKEKEEREKIAALEAKKDVVNWKLRQRIPYNNYVITIRTKK